MSGLVPRLRFKSFTEHSFSTTLGSLINTSMGFAFKSSDFANTGTQLIRMSNLYQGTLTLSRSPVYLPNEFKSNHSKYIVKKGDLLMSMTGTVGKRDYGYVIKVNESADFFLNQRVMKISVKQQASQDYIQYLLTDERFLNRLYSLPGGTKQANLSADQLKSISITVPANKQEQQKIADFLTSVDSKISQLTEKHRLLTQYKKGVMQQIFSQQLRFKDDDGSEFGEWEDVQLSVLATPIKRKAKIIIDNVMTISAGKGFLHQKERFSQVIAGSSLDKYIHLKKGEFSYNRGNSKSYTYGCIYLLEDDEALVPFVYRSFKLNKGIPEFFSQLFKMKYLDRQLRRMISSSARMDGLLNIGEKSFYQVLLPFPHEKEQQKIAQFLQAIDAKIDATNQQLEQTKLFKKSLLQQMFV